MIAIFRELWSDVVLVFAMAYRTLEKLLESGEYKKLAIMMVGLIVAWHIYTPIHELLHVGACLMVGGTVEELALKPQYGGTLLQGIFPFIVPESDYAGQLTGFTTPNKWGYAVVDFLPFVLSFFGGILITWCYKKKSTIMYGTAVILAFVPIISLPGDFFEAASLATSEWLGTFSPELGDSFLISDDAFKLFGNLWTEGQFSVLIIFSYIVTAILSLFLVISLFSFQGRMMRWVYGKEFFLSLQKETSSSKEK